MPTTATQQFHPREPMGSQQTSPRLPSTQRASHKPASPYKREVGLVHRIDVGIHTLATERLIVELRSMDAGELGTLYSWVGQVVEPAKVRTLIADPQTLQWRSVRRGEPHGGESYARQHVLYVHIHAPFEARSNDVNTHAMVQRRFIEWLASDAVGETINAACASLAQTAEANHLQRRFTVAAPNRSWVTDISDIRTHESWLYLAVVVDLFSRQVVGWSMGSRIDTGLVLDALLMALWRRQPK